jgi:microcystin-dependent protein
MSTLKVNEVRHLSNTGSANIVLESNATTNLQATSTLGLTVTGTLTVSGVSTLNGNVVIGNATTDTVNLISTIKGFNNFSGFTGEIRMYAGNAAGDSPPAGWLYCNGDTVSSTSANGGTHYNLDGKGNDYQPLFNLLKASNDWGNTSSATWGTNTVKAPDFRSRAPVGSHTGAATAITAGLTSRTLSDVAGTETHALTIAELAVHTHVTSAAPSNTGQTASGTQPTHTHTVPSGTSGSTTPAITGPPSNNTTTGQSATHTHNTSTEGGSNQFVAAGGSKVSYYSTHWTTTSANSVDHTHGMQSHTHTSAAHTHTTPGSTTSASGNDAVTVTLTDPGHTHTLSTATTGSGTAHTILQPIIAVNYIIKV